jgi:hypothetical protein
MDKYWVGNGSTENWSATAPTNWSDSSGGTNDAAVPTSADNVIFDSGSGLSIIDIATTILSFTVTTGFTGTLQHSAILTIAGNITLNNNYTTTGTGELYVNGTNIQVNTNGRFVSNKIWFRGTNQIVTFLSLFEADEMVMYAISSQRFQGFGFAVNRLYVATGSAQTITLTEGVEYIVKKSLACYFSKQSSILTFVSSSATNRAFITLYPGATCNSSMNYTRIDASRGRNIETFVGVVTDCININRITDLVKKAFASTY